MTSPLFSLTSDDLHASRLKALLTTARVMASDSHLERLLVVIAEQVTRVLDAQRSSVFLYDEALNELRGVVTQGMVPGILRFPADSGLAGFVAQSGETLNIANAPEDPRFNDSYDAWSGFRTRTVLCAPILNASQQLIGVIQVLNKRFGDDAFTDEDEILLETFSAHAAAAIERAWLVERYAEQQRLQESLRVAQEIQMSLLPDTVPNPHVHAGYDLFAHLQPAQVIGGDLYDFSRVDARRLGLAVGDVSGKGIPASLFMNGTYTLLRQAALDGLSPDRCFEHINRVQRNKKAMFVTLFYGLLDLQTGRVTYGNAGHPPPCIVRRDGSLRFADRASNLPLCLLEAPAFHLQHLRLEPGDLLVLYTDGVLEATDSTGEEYGQERLQQAVQQAGACSPRDAVHHLIDDVHTFTGDAPQRDDLTVLALRYQGPRNEPTPAS